MKKIIRRFSPFLVCFILLAACDLIERQPQVSTVDINVRLGSTNAYTNSDFFLGALDPGNSKDYVFTIENLGYSGDLLLTGSPAIALTGVGISVTHQPTVTILAPGASTTFTVHFEPIDSLVYTAHLSIQNNDVGESDYSISLFGTGGTVPGSVFVKVTTPPTDNTPSWIWVSAGGNGTFRYKLDSSDLTTGTTETTATTYTPGSALLDGNHTVYVQEQDATGSFWAATGNASINVVTVVAVGWIGGGTNGWKTTTTSYNWGSDYQSFDSIEDVFVDSSGDLFICDAHNNRISRWSPSGNAIGWIGGGSNGWRSVNGASSGTGYQYFTYPKDMVIDSAGNLIVADAGNRRISKWDAAGNALGWIGGGSNGWKTTAGTSIGTDYQSFGLPDGVCLDTSGNIYVADFSNNRICKWDAAGNAIGWIGGGSNGWKTTTGAPSGSDYQSFGGPNKIFVDQYGNIYVSDYGYNRISKWDAAGNAIGWIGGGSDGWKTTTGALSGADYRSFDKPCDVFVDTTGNIFIADSFNDRICKYSPTGVSQGWAGASSDAWKTYSGTSSQNSYNGFNYPYSVLMDSSGNIFIADHGNNRICKWHQY